MWLHPWDNADKNGAQLAQGLWGMATGGLWGSGLGLGRPEFVPRAGSDSVFASYGEQTGLIGGLVLLSVYALLLARGLHIARRAVTEFDRLLASGLTLLLALQAMIILGGVSGLTPLTGVTLPFVSFGASSLVADFFAVGLLLRLSARTLPEGIADRASPEWTRAARVLSRRRRRLPAARRRRVPPGRRPGPARPADRDAAAADAGPGHARRAGRCPRTSTRACWPTPNAIPRGTIRDRSGTALARAPLSPDEPGQTGLLCPDGRPRVYPGGPACSPCWSWDVERPASPANSLGRERPPARVRPPTPPCSACTGAASCRSPVRRAAKT